MCIAIYCRPTAAPLARALLDTCRRRNPDGMGIVYPKKGRLHVYRTLTDFKGLYHEYLKSVGGPCLLHFRIATHGSVSVPNCHPCIVPNTDDSIALVHNGVINDVTPIDDESDTRAFCRLLGDLPAGWWDYPALHTLIEGYTRPSKLVLMRADGTVLMVNPQLGHWKDNVWFSNDSYRSYQLASSYDTSPTVGYFIKYQRDKVVVCPSCLPSGYKPRWKETITARELVGIEMPWCDWCKAKLSVQDSVPAEPKPTVLHRPAPISVYRPAVNLSLAPKDDKYCVECGNAWLTAASRCPRCKNRLTKAIGFPR